MKRELNTTFCITIPESEFDGSPKVLMRKIANCIGDICAEALGGMVDYEIIVPHDQEQYLDLMFNESMSIRQCMLERFPRVRLFIDKSDNSESIEIRGWLHTIERIYDASSRI